MGMSFIFKVIGFCCSIMLLVASLYGVTQLSQSNNFLRDFLIAMIGLNTGVWALLWNSDVISHLFEKLRTVLANRKI